MRCRNGRPTGAAAELGATSLRVGRRRSISWRSSCSRSRRRRARRGSSRDALGDLPLQLCNARRQSPESRTSISGRSGVRGEFHDGDVEQDPRVGCVAHLSQRFAELLDAAYESGSPESLGLVRQRRNIQRRQLDKIRRHDREEPVAEVADEFFGERPRIASETDRPSRHRQRPAGVALDHRFDELAERHRLGTFTTGARDQFESRQCVARRAPTLSENLFDRSIGDDQAGVFGDPTHMLLQRVCWQQVEL